MSPRRLSPLDSKIKPINPKRNEPQIFIARTDADFPILWQPEVKNWKNWKNHFQSSLEKSLMLGKIEDKWRRGRLRVRWLGSITNSMGLNLSKLWEIVEDRGV